MQDREPDYIDFSQDDYDDPSTYGARIKAFGITGAGAVRILRFNTTGIVAAVLFTVAALLCLFAWLLAKRVTARKEEVVKGEELQKSMRTMEREGEYLEKEIARVTALAEIRGRELIRESIHFSSTECDGRQLTTFLCFPTEFLGTASLSTTILT